MQRAGRANSNSHGSSLKDWFIIPHKGLVGLALIARSQALIKERPAPFLVTLHHGQASMYARAAELPWILEVWMR